MTYDPDLHNELRLSKHLIGRHDQKTHAREDHGIDDPGEAVGAGAIGLGAGLLIGEELGDAASKRKMRGLQNLQDALNSTSAQLDIMDATRNKRAFREGLENLAEQGSISRTGMRNLADVHGELTRADFNLDMLSDANPAHLASSRRNRRAARALDGAKAAAPIAGAVLGTIIANEIQRRRQEDD